MDSLHATGNGYVASEGEWKLPVPTCIAAAEFLWKEEASPLDTEETRDREQKAKARLPTSCSEGECTVNKNSTRISPHKNTMLFI